MTVAIYVPGRKPVGNWVKIGRYVGSTFWPDEEIRVRNQAEARRFANARDATPKNF